MFRLAVVILSCCATLLSAQLPIACPAGAPITNVQLRVKPAKGGPSRPLRGINRVQEGDILLYDPAPLAPGEKRKGKVALIIVPAPASARAEEKLVVLEPKPASGPAQWNVPVRVGVAAFVYGPDGLDVKKVRSYLLKDEELITQLADYAEKTAQTEALLQALTRWNQNEASQSVDAALSGFASQFGLNNKIDRTAPTDQQTLALFRALNPALSSYDPLAPQSDQRVQQTTSLMTAVAGMFFGSSVGLAAGGTAMALNLRSLMFPNTELRSTFAQSLPNQNLALCSRREPSRARTRLAYLWATRVPDATAPSITIGASNNLPAGLKSPLPVQVAEPQWKLTDRAHDWALIDSEGKAIPIGVKTLTDQRSLELDLTASHPAPGKYRLRGGWDWDEFYAKGDVVVRPLSTFEKARLTPESQDHLLQERGKTIVQLEGDDFQFVERAAIVRTGDKYGSPVNVPYSLPRGKRSGMQDRLELEVDTKPLPAGDYSLLLVQQDGQAKPVPVKVLPPPPRIQNLPLLVNVGEARQRVSLRGENLQNLTKIESAQATLQLGALSANQQEREVHITLNPGVQPGSAMDLRAYVQDYAQPLTLNNGLKVVGPRPRILNSKFSLPAELEVNLRTGELPAGAFVSTMLQVQNVGPDSVLRLGCRSGGANEVAVRVGEQQTTVRLQSMSADTLFLSFDPGTWQTGCIVEGRLDNGGEGQSKPYQLGRVVRIPHVDSFKLTEEKAGENEYIGVLEGRDLETIEKVGWDGSRGFPVQGLPTPIAGEGQKQALRILLPWPAPSPHAPLYIWFRGERDGRQSKVKYGER